MNATYEILNKYRSNKDMNELPDNFKANLLTWFENSTDHQVSYTFPLIMDILLWCHFEMRDKEMFPPELRKKYLTMASAKFGIKENHIITLYNKHYSLLSGPLKKKTKIIAFEGIDGSGKTIQIDMLASLINSLGYTFKLKSFPEYSSFFGVEIGELLSGSNENLNANTIDPKSMSLWYGLDRWKSFQQSSEETVDYLLLNRYTLSSAVYQSIRCASKEAREHVGDWILELEHDHLKLPKPDLYIIFDLPYKISKNNVISKGYRDYVGTNADVYESSKYLQDMARVEYKRLADKLEYATIINTMENNETMRSVESIHLEVVGALKRWSLLNTIV